MWYPSQQQQQQCWHRYMQQTTSPPSSAQQQQHHRTYTRTSYYYNSSANDESLGTNLPSSYPVSKSDMSQAFVHHQAIHNNNNDVVYETSQTDYYAAVSSESYGDEMPPSTPSQPPNPHWNPTIAAPRRSSPVVDHKPDDQLMTIPRSSALPSAACWDWLLYSPELDSHLHTPSSSFVPSIKQHEDDLDLLMSLPSWLLVLLSPSNSRIRSTDDENESDQEMTSLHRYYRDEPFLSPMHVDHGSSQLTSSSESLRTDLSSSQLALYAHMQEEKNRSSTPDTDDGYQSASDASRSDYSQQLSLPYEPLMTRKDQTIFNGPTGLSSSSMAHRLSYAAAAKPITSLPSTTAKSNSLVPGSGVKGKQPMPLLSSKGDSSSNANGQKLKFIAPRFERMHHAKQYSSPSTTAATMAGKDSSSSTHRSQSRANNHVQRHPMIQSTRRR